VASCATDDPAGTVTLADPELVVVPAVQVAEVPFGRLPAVNVTLPLNPFVGEIETT
jgi:hypothetical protein